MPENIGHPHHKTTTTADLLMLFFASPNLFSSETNFILQQSIHHALFLLCVCQTSDKVKSWKPSNSIRRTSFNENLS